MMVYLVQHGEANPEDIDPQRNLTEKGRNDVARIATHVARLHIPLKQIRHSGKTRAAQTASIIADHLVPGCTPESTDKLSPKDDPCIWEERIQSIQEDLMLVGHLPHLERLAALLLCGDSERKVINFQMAGVVCLKRTGTTWGVEWIITPAVAL